MQELISINQDQYGNRTVSARDLHGFLEVNSKFADWIKNRIDKYDFIEGIDFVTYSKSLEKGRPEIEYALSLDMAKELSMVESNDRGKEARKYFIAVEKLAKQVQQAIPSYQIEDPILRAERWIEEQKIVKQLANKAVNLETALDNLLDWISILKVAAHNKVSEKAFKWQLLKKQSHQMGYIIKKGASPRFGYQNLYHVDVFRTCYPEYDYNFKTEDY